MSYTHGLHQHQLAAVTALSFATTGIKTRYLAAGIRPIKIKGIAVIIETDITVTAAVITCHYRPTINSATGQVDFTTLTLPVGVGIGKAVYKTGLNQLVAPGAEVAFDVTTAATAGTGHIVIETEPVWEMPANNTKMVASA